MWNMAQPWRIQYVGTIYHIMSRGVGKYTKKKQKNPGARIEKIAYSAFKVTPFPLFSKELKISLFYLFYSDISLI